MKRFFGRIIIAAVMSVGQLVFCEIATGQIVALPASVNFPAVAFGNHYGFPNSSTATIKLINSSNEGTLIESLQFSLAEFAPSSTFHPLPLGPGKSLNLDISFNPSRADQFQGSVKVLGYSSKLLVEVPLFGAADCWSPLSCEPKGPTCRINKNNEPWQPFSVPQFFATVSPALDQQAYLHAQAIDYDLPVDFLLKIAGLAGVVQINPPLSCCDKTIHFTRITSSRLRERFTRSASSDTAADGSIGGYTVHVSIPKDTSGVTVVGGGFSEFDFDSGKEPALLIQYNGQKIFDGPITCMNATFSDATLRQLNSGTALPHLNIEVK